MAKMIRSGQKEVVQDEELSYYERYRQNEKAAPKPVLQSNIPARASAHPSAIASVQPRYRHRFTGLERATHLDVTRVPTLPQAWDRASSLGKIAHPTGHAVRDVAHERAMLADVDTIPNALVQRKREDVLLEVAEQREQPLANMYAGTVAKTTRRRTFCNWHYVDDVRWWLLYPGRLEFLLWLVGVLVLISVTGLFVLMVTMSMAGASF
jgi:hypothetical protein